MNNTLALLRGEMIELQDQLVAHPLFDRITGPDDLRLFMEWHVFAVWDFVSLLKRLQRELTGSGLPWTPPEHPRAARLFNEIVLKVESDLLPDGKVASQFEHYLGLMRGIGAATDQVEAFVDAMRQGISLEAALSRTGLPPAVAAFVRATLNTALNGDLDQVLGSFFHGREIVGPVLFRRLIEGGNLPPEVRDSFCHYMRRHADSANLAEVVRDLVGEDEKREENLMKSAVAALKQRLSLWSALLECLQCGPHRRVAE